jgi:hypothetical protein
VGVSKPSGMIDMDPHSPHAESSSQSGAALTDFCADPFNEQGLGYPGRSVGCLKLGSSLHDKKIDKHQ